MMPDAVDLYAFCSAWVRALDHLDAVTAAVWGDEPSRIERMQREQRHADAARAEHQARQRLTDAIRAEMAER